MCKIIVGSVWNQEGKFHFRSFIGLVNKKNFLQFAMFQLRFVELARRRSRENLARNQKKAEGERDMVTRKV